MVIGISIDEVLRDFLGKLTSVYKQQFNKDNISPVESFDLEHYFPTKEHGIDFNSFLYQESSIEIFGYANEASRNAITYLNQIYDEYKDKYKFIIISKEFGNSIPATLFFLSKTSCKLRDYKFINSDAEVWEYVDFLITANPSMILSKPNNDKKIIKIITTYNDKLKCDYDIEQIKDVIDLKILDTINNTKMADYEIIK